MDVILLMSKRRRDEIDWKDDLLTAIELAVAVIMGLLFHDYLTTNPSVADVLQAEALGLYIISFGFFLGIFLFVKWLNREKV